MTRQVILFIHTTLNGVVTGDPDRDKEDFGGQWTRAGNLVGEASETLVRLFDRADTILMGHGSYEALSKRWPEMQGPDGADDVTSRLAAKINGAHKRVVSRDASSVDLSWGEFEAAELMDGNDVIAQVRELKGVNGGDIVIFGSPVLVRSLADEGLIDEYYIVLHPVVIETGDRLFDGTQARTDLTLKHVTELEEGGVLVAYDRVNG